LVRPAIRSSRLRLFVGVIVYLLDINGGVVGFK
jgi:hypothetical protein